MRFDDVKRPRHAERGQASRGWPTAALPADNARRPIAEFRVGEASRWRDNNKIKAAYLQRAIAVERRGIGLLAASMVVILL
jgi:hypothetical protein